MIYCAFYYFYFILYEPQGSNLIWFAKFSFPAIQLHDSLPICRCEARKRQIRTFSRKCVWHFSEINKRYLLTCRFWDCLLSPGNPDFFINLIYSWKRVVSQHERVRATSLPLCVTSNNKTMMFSYFARKSILSATANAGTVGSFLAQQLFWIIDKYY